MKDELITLETFKLAKEKGFDLKICNCGGFPDCICDQDKNAPTQSLLQRWLRENHDIHISVTHEHMGFRLVVEGKANQHIPVSYYVDLKTYEQALEAGLYEALKQIKP